MARNSYMVDILPAILVHTWEELVHSLSLVRGIAPEVQIDVVDGILAPGATWPYRDTVHFEHIVSGEEGMPLWENFDFEFDLMVSKPEEEVQQYLDAGASRLVLHLKSGGIEESLEELKEAREGGEYGVKVGLALAPTDSPDVLDSYENQFDFIQVMGIANIGLQGQVMHPDTFALVKELRKRHPDKTIQVDGGVKIENVQALASAGANRLVCGSAIFGVEDPTLAFKALRKEANR